MSRPARPPKYPVKKHFSGQARIVVNGRHVYLGPFGSEASYAEYSRIVAEWRPGVPVAPSGTLTVGEVILAFLRHAEAHYRDPLGNPATELVNFRYALRPLRRLYGHTPAKDFRAKALKAVQGEMVRLGWSPRPLNRNIVRVRTMFRWAESEELVPAGTFEHLRTVRGLPAGRILVEPVPEDVLAVTLPELRPVPRAMVEFQLLTGCRPGECVRLRPMDLDRSALAGVWVYRPGSDAGECGQHKTAHLGIAKLILIGPKAQAVLAPFLDRDPAAFCFSPREATPAHLLVEGRQRMPGKRYSVETCRQAIEYACKRAKVETWTPNRLRKNAASRLASEFGEEVARTVLGHADVQVTRRHYISPDLQRAAEAIREVG